MLQNLRYPLTLILLAVLTFSCQSNPNATTSDSQAQKSLNLTEMMAPFTPKTQTFTVSGKKPSVVTGKAGTKIHVEPKNLTKPDGSPIVGDIQVNLIECTKKSELLGAGLQTVSNGKLLESGGSYYIDMEADGQKLAIQEGKSVAVEFPKVSDKNMELFYGQKDETGQMNWDAADVDFKNAKSQPKSAAVSDSSTTTFSVQSDTIYGYVSGKDTIRSSNIDDILAYMEAEDGGKPAVNSSKSTLKKGRTTNKEQSDNSLAERNRQNELSMKNRRTESEKAEKEKAALAELKSAQDERSRQFAAENDRFTQLYKAVDIKNFGWINCDRFYNESNVAPVIVELPEKITSAIVYIAFSDINSILSLNYYDGMEAVESQNIPVGQQIEVMAMTQGKNSIGYEFARTTITVGSDNVVALEPKPMAKADIQKQFDAI
ncbi:MAG: hypothetical protein RLZZ519_2451 [Bacteroidota bacterium]